MGLFDIIFDSFLFVLIHLDSTRQIASDSRAVSGLRKKRFHLRARAPALSSREQAEALRSVPSTKCKCGLDGPVLRRRCLALDTRQGSPNKSRLFRGAETLSSAIALDLIPGQQPLQSRAVVVSLRAEAAATLLSLGGGKRRRDLRFLLIGRTEGGQQQLGLTMAGLVAPVVEWRGQDRRLVEPGGCLEVPLQ